MDEDEEERRKERDGGQRCSVRRNSKVRRSDRVGVRKQSWKRWLVQSQRT